MTEIAATFKHIPSISLQSFQQQPSRARIHKKIRFLGKFFLPSLLSASCAMHEASHNHVSRKFDGPPPRNHQCGSSVPRCRPEIAGPRGHGQRSAALEQEQRNHRKPRPPRPRVCTRGTHTELSRDARRERLRLFQSSMFYVFSYLFICIRTASLPAQSTSRALTRRGGPCGTRSSR